MFFVLAFSNFNACANLTSSHLNTLDNGPPSFRKFLMIFFSLFPVSSSILFHRFFGPNVHASKYFFSENKRNQSSAKVSISSNSATLSFCKSFSNLLVAFLNVAKFQGKSVKKSTVSTRNCLLGVSPEN